MRALPEVDEKFNLVTIITPDGVHQLNQEIKAFKCLITADEFKAKHGSLFLTRSAQVTATEGELIHDELTLAQLNILESSIRMRHGHTIIGYSINEEVFLRLLGEYPPAPAAFSKRVLDSMHTPIVRDISVSIRSGAQSLIFFGYLAQAYFQYDKKNAAAFDDYFYTNVLLFLLVSTGVSSFSMLLLRSGLLDKQVALSRINRLMLIEESVIGTSKNWTTYGALISLPPSLIAYGILPVIFCGALKGYYDSDQRYANKAINIANKTTFNTLQRGMGYALTTGSFFSLGLEDITLDLVFANNIDDFRGFSQDAYDLLMIQYTAFAISFMAHIARHPHLPDWIQVYGRYGSNISNTMARVLLDNFANISIISMMLQLTIGRSIASNQIGLLSVLYGLQAVTFFYCVYTTIAVTPDLPEFSIEYTPPEKSISSLCTQKIGQLINSLTSSNKAEKNNVIQRHASIELVAPMAPRDGFFASSHKEKRHLYAINEAYNNTNPLHSEINAY